MLRSSASTAWRCLGLSSHYFPPSWVEVMPTWSPQRYRFVGERQGVATSVLDAAFQINERIRRADPRLPTVLTLRHLSILTGTSFGYLRRIVGRRELTYKQFRLRKYVPGRTRHRHIHVPEAPLMRVQQWIAYNILRYTSAHVSSFAYHPECQPVLAAKAHCGCKWLLKIDIEDFFHSISEGKIFQVFKALGYAPLLAFEMTRITTVVLPQRSMVAGPLTKRWNAIPACKSETEGCLPQGAPTSPMLSNLVMKRIDQKLADIADLHGFRYTRYADDLAFSTELETCLATVKRIKRLVYSVLLEAGFVPNRQKSTIRGPGARRIVLGILVDGPQPRLAKEFKDSIRQHLYYLASERHGPAVHAVVRKTSLSTLYHHIRGKIGWAEQVEPAFGSACLKRFERIDWPPIDSDR